LAICKHKAAAIFSIVCCPSTRIATSIPSSFATLLSQLSKELVYFVCCSHRKKEKDKKL